MPQASIKGKIQSDVLSVIGGAEAILLRAKATGAGIETIAGVLKSSPRDGSNAVSLMIAEKYMEAFGSLAKSSTTVLLPGGTGSISSDPASFVTQVSLLKWCRLYFLYSFLGLVSLQCRQEQDSAPTPGGSCSR